MHHSCHNLVGGTTPTPIGERQHNWGKAANVQPARTGVGLHTCMPGSLRRASRVCDRNSTRIISRIWRAENCRSRESASARWPPTARAATASMVPVAPSCHPLRLCFTDLFHRLLSQTFAADDLDLLSSFQGYQGTDKNIRKHNREGITGIWNAQPVCEQRFSSCAWSLYTLALWHANRPLSSIHKQLDQDWYCQKNTVTIKPIYRH